MSEYIQHPERHKIHNYLQSLGLYLARLETNESNEVLREIESHIYDAIDLNEQQGKSANVEEILARFGPPRELAEQYVSHIVQGTPPPTGMAAINIVKRTVSKGVYWSTAAFGYFTGFILILLGFAKLLAPNNIGLWASSNNNSFIIGAVESSEQLHNELLGMWFIPVALLVGYLIIRVTATLMRTLKSFKE
ncbi:HAAS signaling domain-containing protein [Pseudoalteromonas sp. T1lg65]|uniref:HAAS signaling domain-containing protein n=1 Tax=Pseudoalteromonas sp. T1lg65 TaxID=2077101 RepID=UPI003F7AE2A8